MRKSLQQVLLLASCMFLTTAVLCPPRAHAVPRYHITSLSFLIGSGVSPVAMNDHRQIVGYRYDSATQTTKGFRWTPGAGVRDLGSLSQWTAEPKAINNLGQVVGACPIGHGPTGVGFLYHGFLWTENGGMRDLGTLTGASESYAHDINDSGQVAGISGSSAVRWDGTAINTLGEAGYNVAINSLGQVATDWAVFNPNGSRVNLQWPTGADYRWAYDINDSGVVVGEGYFSQEDECDFGLVWNPDGTVRRLGVLYPVHSSHAMDINNRGEVVGYCDNEGLVYYPNPSGWPHAFIWTASGGMKDLNTMLSYSQRYWKVQEAIDINNKGEILAKGLNPQGQTDYFMLTIIPEPSSLLALTGGLSALGFMLRRRR